MYYFGDYRIRNQHQSVVLITAPTADVVDISDVKAALGISSTSQDGIISAALGAVISSLDPASGGWLGRALRPQTWELRLSSFYEHRHCWDKWGHGAIELPYPPLISITSIKYDDYSGTERTLVENTDFRKIDTGSNGKQAVAPLYNGTWPNARCDLGSVRIRYQCGYADSTLNDTIPAAIVQAITLGVRSIMSSVGNNFITMDKVEGVGEKRYQVTQQAADVARMAVELLIGTYRVF